MADLDALLRDLERIPDELRGGVIADALNTGGEIFAKKARERAVASIKHSGEATGQMAASIKPLEPKISQAGGIISVAPTGMRKLEDGPRGGRKKAIRNAEVGFVHNYGASGQTRTEFMTIAADEAVDEAVDAAADIITNKLLEILGG